MYSMRATMKPVPLNRDSLLNDPIHVAFDQYAIELLDMGKVAAVAEFITVRVPEFRDPPDYLSCARRLPSGLAVEVCGQGITLNGYVIDDIAEHDLFATILNRCVFTRPVAAKTVARFLRTLADTYVVSSTVLFLSSKRNPNGLQDMENEIQEAFGTSANWTGDFLVAHGSMIRPDVDDLVSGLIDPTMWA